MAILTNMTTSSVLLETQKKSYCAPASGSSVYKRVGLLIMTGTELNAHLAVTERAGNLHQVGSGWFDFREYAVKNDKTYFISYMEVPEAGHQFFIEKTSSYVGMDGLRTKVVISTDVPESVDKLWNYGDADFMAWGEKMREADAIKSEIRKANSGEGYVSLSRDANGKLVGTWNVRSLGLTAKAA